MKKNKKEQRDPAATPANWNNPFAELKIDLPKEEPPPPPPPPTPEELKQAQLSDADRELLKVFGGDFVEHGDNGKKAGNRGKVTFNIQRKGKGGKTVTIVHGLAKLDLTEQMELCNQVKNALGCGARFLEGTLEIQGDQRTRAAQWFADNGFNC